MPIHVTIPVTCCICPKVFHADFPGIHQRRALVLGSRPRRDIRVAIPAKKFFVFYRNASIRKIKNQFIGAIWCCPLQSWNKSVHKSDIGIACKRPANTSTCSQPDSAGEDDSVYQQNR